MLRPNISSAFCVYDAILCLQTTYVHIQMTLMSRGPSATAELLVNNAVVCVQILKVLCETAVAVRTKALKCLTAVIEADPAILARVSMSDHNSAGFSLFFTLCKGNVIWQLMCRYNWDV